ncbi:MAG: DNA mismatch repair endonuclease MutL, partial [Desulfobacteraceae bacterium]
MSIIRILPEELASQIAAGEVVERPSSVVKELLENSIDSGATNIEVRISNGGKRRIKIIDNGVGMSRDDLILCVERHATSKILSLADLYSVRTLGFRGEALSSIASVARLKIQSRLHDRIEGHAIAVEGCKFLGVQEIGCPPGTNIEVRDLFFNVPARKKFLRGDRVETDHILDVFERIILPYPQIRFVMESEEKDSSMVYSASDDPVTRIAAVIGKQVAETMESLEISAGEFSMTAYLGAGEMARPRADNLYTYLNGRFIRDRLLTRAVLEGYSSRIIKGHYPQCVVFVNAPPGEVDVNVHPAKQEVRFRDAHSMFGFIAGGIAKTLSRKMFPASSPPDSFMEHSPYTEPKDYKYSAASEHRAEYLPASGTQTISGQTVPHEGYCDDLPVVIGQLNGTYVLCESRDGLLLIDQHAAHERIIYETLKSHLSSSSIPTQSFLVPQQIELSF